MARCAIRAASIVFCLALAMRATADSNPIVTQGGTTAMPATGSMAPATGLTWDIVLSGTTVASSKTASGWSASYNATTKDITVQAPTSAKLAANYEVRIASSSGTTDYSALFDVDPGIKSVSILPNSVVGGGPATGTLKLTAVPAQKTVVNLKSSVQHVSVPATVTVPAGSSSVAFTIHTKPIPKDGTADITASLGGVTLDASLKLYAKSNLSFKAPVVYSLAAAPDGLFAADIDGDGKQDVITGGPTGWGVLYGRGDGTLKPYKLIYQWSGGITVREVADLNGDGKPDVVAIDGGGNVLIFLNKGKGSFKAPQIFNIANASGATAADFNRDGHVDLLIVSSQQTSYNGGAQILLNKGDGTFKLGSSWNPGMFVQGHFAGKLRDQKNVDLVISGATESGSRISIMYGDGKGNFTAGPTFDGGNINTGSAFIADVNGDGIPDIAFATWEGGSIDVLYGQADGSFTNPIAYECNSYAATVCFVDMDGDGQPDMVVGLAGTYDIAVLLNQKGIFPTFTRVGTGGGDVRSIAVADLNGDGKPDVICQGGSTNSISVLINNRP
jgi:hypothetical protein